MAGPAAAASDIEADGKPWPRLLAWWHDGCLRSIVLHGDGRRTHGRTVAAATAHTLTALLAQALSAARQPVRHAVLVSDVAPASHEDLCASLALQTLCLVSRDQASGLALPELAPTQCLLDGAGRSRPVLCCLSTVTLVDAQGGSPVALIALLRQPWQGRRLGDELHRSEALAQLCGLLALAEYDHVVLRGDVSRRQALASLDWHQALAPFGAPPPAISWVDDDDQPCWTGAARALSQALRVPAPQVILLRIRSAYAHLTPSERRVADVILASPADALEMATARLADAARVSQPQVIRFCRALGFEGVKALKRALAFSMGARTDALGAHPLLVRGQQALAGLDRHALSAAARLLAGAAQVDVTADAERAPLGDLALRMLWRLGRSARLLEAGRRSTAPVCLSLGMGAVAADGTAIVIAEQAEFGMPMLQFVTGPESPRAPLLLATLVLQMMLAEIAPARRPSVRGVTPAR